MGISSGSNKQGNTQVLREKYDLKAVRELLASAFDANELGRFLRGSKHSQIQRIQRNLNSRMSIDEMIDVVLDHCLRFIILDQLLEEVQDFNPHQFGQFASQIHR